MLGLEAVRRKREARYERFVRALDGKHDHLAAEVETRRRALTGGQQAEARWILGTIPTVNAFKDGRAKYEVPGRRARMSARANRPVLPPSAAVATSTGAGEPAPESLECGEDDCSRDGVQRNEQPGVGGRASSTLNRPISSSCRRH